MKHFLLLLTISFIAAACNKIKDDPKPVTLSLVNTGDIGQITPNSAIISGEVLSDGNATVIERGITIGLSIEPTTANSRLVAGAGTGAFTANATGLQAATTYHVRAYAINLAGTAYGLDKTFTTAAVIPTLTTTAITEITPSAAKSGGQVSSDGGTPVTTRGICWGLNPSPTIADNKTTDGSGTGSFISALSGLELNKKYYVRAYATNSVGTAYGNELTFNTPATLIPVNGLIGWWPFNGNANDESGNANNGEVSGAALSLDRQGKAQSAFRFNGVSDFIKLKSVTVTDMSVSVWYAIESGSNLNPSSGHPPSGSQLIAQGTMHSPTTYCDYSVGITDYFSKPQYSFEQSLPAAGFEMYYADLTPAYVTWIHVVYTIQSNKLKLYENGKLVATSDLVGAILQGGPDLSFGARVITNAGITNYFKGSLDDIGIWNRALSAEEVLKIYNGTGF